MCVHAHIHIRKCTKVLKKTKQKFCIDRLVYSLGVIIQISSSQKM